MTTEYNLLTFKAISKFINDLSEVFSTQQHALKLYQRLVNKTTINHDKAMGKHIEAFKHFCVVNREALETKNITKLVENKIEYSERVFIDFASIFRLSDSETSEVIWKHLLTISAFVDPASRAKEILKKNSSGKEGDFLANIIDKVEQNVDPNSTNPMEAVSQIMKSGVFTDLLSGMNNGLQDGSLDLGKLMSTVQNLCTNLTPPSADGSSPKMPGMPGGAGMPDMSQLFNSLGSMTGQGSNGGMPPDLNNMMSTLMSGLTNQSKPSLEEIISAKPQSLVQSSDMD